LERLDQSKKTGTFGGVYSYISVQINESVPMCLGRSTECGPERSAEVAAKKKSSSKPIDGAPKEKELSLKQRLIKALAHPLRVKILDYMNGREWSPRELEAELSEGLSQVSYHVKVLRDFELIEMTRTEPRRGAVEHYYRAVERAFVPSGMAKDIPKSAQKIIGNGILDKIEQDVGASIKSGKFYARDDWHTSWTPADLDDQGRQDAEKLADKFIEGFLKIEGESANRRAESKDGGEHIWTSAGVLVFGSDLGEEEKAPSRKKSRKRKGASASTRGAQKSP
jgi:DNA-binding transcriptional ArsR family regulator